MGSSKTSSKSVVLQDRDLALLKGLFESRVMTSKHVAAVYFNGRSEMTKKRLQQLKSAGYISARTRGVSEKAILFLASKGLDLLRAHGALTEYPLLSMPALDKRSRVSALTLRHELEVMDVKAAFHASVAKTDIFSVAEFSTWPLLYQFEAARAGEGDVLVKPDGFIRIHENEANDGLSEHTFFLEIDRSTETQDTLVSRANSYLDYYKSGGFAVKNGGARSAYKEYPFRVLMVFKTAERRNNMTERLLQNNPPILTQVCLATIAEAANNPLGSIWIRPIDYLNATKATPFAVGQERVQWGYQRRTAREVFVEKHVKKHRLLSEGAATP